MDNKLLEIISKRKTARLVETDNIVDTDIEIIKQVILKSPSLDKRFPYKVFFLTNSDEGKLLKNQLIEYYRCHTDRVGDTWENKEIVQPILSGLTIVFVQQPTPLIIDTNRELEMVSVRDITVAGTLAMLAGESLGYATGMFGACTDPVGAATIFGGNNVTEKVRLVITIAKKDIGLETIFKNANNPNVVDAEEHKVFIDHNGQRPFTFVLKHRWLPITTEISTI